MDRHRRHPRHTHGAVRPSLFSQGNFGGDINVGTLDAVSIRGAPLRVRHSRSSSIGNVLLGSAANSEIFSGIRSDLTALPSTAADFPNRSGSIKSVIVKSKAANAFSNTQIAGANIDHVMIASIQTSNGGTPFGIAADRINLLKVDNPSSCSRACSPRLTTPTISLGGDAVLWIDLFRPPGEPKDAARPPVPDWCRGPFVC